jgi:hypothetical protein
VTTSELLDLVSRTAIDTIGEGMGAGPARDFLSMLARRLEAVGEDELASRVRGEVNTG